MSWPFVSRKKHNALRRRFRQYRERSRSVVDRSRQEFGEAVATARAVAEARIDAMQKLLEDERRERQDLQLKLLRVSFNINPFYELMQAEQSQSSILPQADSAQPQNPFQVSPSMSHEEVRATFVAEALEKYPGNMRMVQRHVERRQAEYYQNRNAPPPLVSAAEMQAAQQVDAGIKSAIAEGAAAAAQGK